jgi:hypothetical protein
MYISAVSISVLLFLRHYFYNVIFKIRQIIHSLDDDDDDDDMWDENVLIG